MKTSIPAIRSGSIRLKAVEALPTTGKALHLVPAYRASAYRKGSFELLAAWSQSPFLRAVVSRISQIAASVEWVARVKGETVEDHPALDVINAGNPFMTRIERERLMYAHEDLIGESAALIERDSRGMPVRLFAFPPTWITQVPRPGADYFTVTPWGGNPIDLPRSEVLFRREVDPLRPYERGSGLAHALADEIAVDESAARHMAAVLKNRARPDVIVSGDAKMPLDAENVARFESRWQEHAGPERAGLPMFTGGPVTVSQISQTFEQMQLVSARQFEMDVVIAVYGLPPELVGKLVNSNRATIDAADYHASKHVIVPRLDARKEALNTQLAPYWPDLEFDYISPVAEDHEFALEVMKARPSAFTEDEARALAGLDPLPGGVGRVLPRSAVIMYEPVPEDQSGDMNTRAALPMRKAVDVDDIDALLDEALADTGELSAALRAVLAAVLAEFGTDAIEAVGVDIDFTLQDPRVIEFLENASSDRVTMITETTRDRLRSTLGAGVSDGESTDKLIARIRDEVEGATVSRARTISRTEIVRASNYATMEGHRQAGVRRREWLATADDRVRDSHDALGSMGPIPIDEPFIIPAGHDNAGRTAMYPGDFGVPEEDINCRCAILPVLDIAPERRGMIWKAMDNKREPFEAQLERLVYRAIANQMKRVADKLRSMA